MKPKIAVTLVLLSGLLTAGAAVFHNFATSPRTQAPSIARVGSQGGNRLYGRSELTQKIVIGPEDLAAQEIRERKAAHRLQVAIAARRALATPVASAPTNGLIKRPHSGLLQGMELVTVDGKLQVGLLP